MTLPFPFGGRRADPGLVSPDGQTGENLVALLTASLHQDAVLALQIWRGMDDEEQEDVMFLLLGFLRGQIDLAAELMDASPTAYQEFILQLAKARLTASGASGGLKDNRFEP